MGALHPFVHSSGRVLYSNLQPQFARFHGNFGYTLETFDNLADVLPLMGDNFDAILVVNDPQWHEFMPKPVLPYNAIYGIDQPRTPPLSNNEADDPSYSIFASADSFKGDLFCHVPGNRQRGDNGQEATQDQVDGTCDIPPNRVVSKPLKTRTIIGKCGRIFVKRP